MAEKKKVKKSVKPATSAIPAKKKKAVSKQEEVVLKKKKSSSKEEAPAKKVKSGKAKPVRVKKVKEVPVYTPVKEKLNRTQLIEHLAEETELDKKQIKSVLDAIEQVIFGSVTHKGVGEFQIPGLLKIKTVHKPATKGGEKKKNPFKPGEMMITKAKPATVKVKILPLKKLKDAAIPPAKVSKK